MDSPEAETLFRELAIQPEHLPIVVDPGGPLLRNPEQSGSFSTPSGLVEPLGRPTGPRCVISLSSAGGPAGLAAAVYGASEGLTTTLAEDTALGGQAGTSSRIENYLGFPAGLSGDELTARAALQARNSGCGSSLRPVRPALCTEGTHEVTFEDGEVVRARSVIIATGARYNRLPLDRLTELEGVGVYYAASQMEAQACGEKAVVVVGGGTRPGRPRCFLLVRPATCTFSFAGIPSRSTMSRVPDRPDRGSRPHTRVAPYRGLRADRRLPPRRRRGPPHHFPGDRHPADRRAVRLHRRGTQHRLARRAARRGRARLLAHGTGHPGGPPPRPLLCSAPSRDQSTRDLLRR